MISGFPVKLQNTWFRWARNRNITGNPQKFNSKNIYILPSLFGIAFAFMVLSFFLCAINYQINSIFLLSFMLVILGMGSAWIGHNNMKGITVHCLSIADVYQGEAVKIILLLTAEHHFRYQIQFGLPNTTYTAEVVTDKSKQVTLHIPAEKRGHFQIPRITFFTYFPLGLFRIWGYAYFEESYYVYPACISPGYWPNSLEDIGKTVTFQDANEEFYSLKEVTNPWTQASRIAWKIAARGQGWYLKTMITPQGNHYWLFRIQDLPLQNVEQNLQHLCYWLSTAEQQGDYYGLELKGEKPTLSRGPSHLITCLRQLANY